MKVLNMIRRMTSLQKKRLLSTSLFVVLVITVLSIASTIFFPIQQDGFSELSLITYNSSSETFEADNYPYRLESGTNTSVFFMVKNFENTVKYYQIRIKATKISQYVTYEYPLNSTLSFQLYNNTKYEKIVASASPSEKREVGTFTGDYIWGPVNVTLYSNSELESVLEGEGYVKIVFELWEFNSSIEIFEYSGIFTFLEIGYTY